MVQFLPCHAKPLLPIFHPVTMNYLKQFALLISVCFVGEILHAILPIPVPASIYGLVVMFTLLQLKIVPLSAIEQAAAFLLAVMPIFFVPSTVGVITAGAILKKFGAQFLLIGIVATIIVFAVTGQATQIVIRLSRRKNEKSASTEEEKANHE